MFETIQKGGAQGSRSPKLGQGSKSPNRQGWLIDGWKNLFNQPFLESLFVGVAIRVRVSGLCRVKSWVFDYIGQH